MPNADISDLLMSVSWDVMDRILSPKRVILWTNGDGDNVELSDEGWGSIPGVSESIGDASLVQFLFCRGIVTRFSNGLRGPRSNFW